MKKVPLNGAFFIGGVCGSWPREVGSAEVKRRQRRQAARRVSALARINPATPTTKHKASEMMLFSFVSKALCEFECPTVKNAHFSRFTNF